LGGTLVGPPGIATHAPQHSLLAGVDRLYPAGQAGQMMLLVLIWPVVLTG